jgi:tetratricopeptide (TPR) repeat protein
MNLGLAFINLGEFDKAISALIESITLAEKLGDPTSESVRLGNLGNAYLRNKEIELSISTYRRAISVDRKINSEKLDEHLFSLGIILVDQEFWYDGLGFLDECLAIRRKLGELDSLADITYQLARAHHLMGNFDKSRTHYRDSLRLYERLNNQLGKAACRMGLGRLMIQMNFVKEANNELIVAKEIYQLLNDQKRVDDVEEMLKLNWNIAGEKNEKKSG